MDDSFLPRGGRGHLVRKLGPAEGKSGPWRVARCHSRNVPQDANMADARAGGEDSFGRGPNSRRSGVRAVPHERRLHRQTLQERRRSNRDVPARRSRDDVELPRCRLAKARLGTTDRRPAHEPVGTEPERHGKHDRAYQNSEEQLGVPVHAYAQAASKHGCSGRANAGGELYPSWDSIVPASLTSNLPGASTLTCFTTPSSTRSEKRRMRVPRRECRHTAGACAVRIRNQRMPKYTTSDGRVRVPGGRQGRRLSGVGAEIGLARWRIPH